MFSARAGSATAGTSASSALAMSLSGSLRAGPSPAILDRLENWTLRKR